MSGLSLGTLSEDILLELIGRWPEESVADWIAVVQPCCEWRGKASLELIRMSSETSVETMHREGGEDRRGTGYPGLVGQLCSQKLPVKGSDFIVDA